MGREHNRKFMDSTCQMILIAAMCFFLGMFVGGNHIDFTNGKQVIVGLLVAGVLGLLILLYYSYQMARIRMNTGASKKVLNYWYWGMVLALYVGYLYEEYPRLIVTYEKNSLGINQEQYVVLVNLVIFLIVGAIGYCIFFGHYQIKNISKDGIELEKELEVQVLETNTDIISKIGEQLGALDEVVNEFDIMGYVDRHLDYESYIDLLERILYPITEQIEELYIGVYSPGDYKEYMFHEKGYAKAMVKKAFYNLRDCGIIKVEDSIHIKYKLANFQQYEESEVYIIIEMGSLYDIKVGELIYGYIKCFEALYAKYI